MSTGTSLATKGLVTPLTSDAPPTPTPPGPPPPTPIPSPIATSNPVYIDYALLGVSRLVLQMRKP